MHCWFASLNTFSDSFEMQMPYFHLASAHLSPSIAGKMRVNLLQIILWMGLRCYSPRRRLVVQHSKVECLSEESNSIFFVFCAPSTQSYALNSVPHRKRFNRFTTHNCTQQQRSNESAENASFTSIFCARLQLTLLIVPRRKGFEAAAPPRKMEKSI